jgi:hypothetical protein
MSYNNADLKIQFRAVPYTSDSHVLEWRVNPEQDLTYYTYHKFLFFRWRKKHQYDTEWHQPRRFCNHSTARYYDENDYANWFPYWIENQCGLDWYKNNFKTLGEFFKYQDEDIAIEKDKWRLERANYLANHKIFY